MWLSRREWRRHARELLKAETRADNAERRLDELLNRWLTRQGSQGIQRATEAATPQQSILPPKSETISGWTEDEYIEELKASGKTEGEARASWEKSKTVGLLPFQMEGELPS